MKARNYREMSMDELTEKMQDLQKRVFEMRSQSVTEKLENYKSIINTRKEIARVKTVMSEISKQGNN
jgi:large subunit ribosomal protein L29